MQRYPWIVAAVILCCAFRGALADEVTRPTNENPPGSVKPGDDSVDAGEENSPSKDEMVALNEQGTILLDRKAKKVHVKTKVVLREGMLEMLMCLQQTKEHESILALNGEAKILHAGLLAIGLEAGKPVEFVPDYKPPAGPEVRIELIWKDTEGKEQRALAQQWIRHSIHRYFAAPLDALPNDVMLADDDPLRFDPMNKELSWYGPMSEKEKDAYRAMSSDKSFQKAVQSFYDRTRSRPMEAKFVFTGSQFVNDRTTGERVYLAESGDVICVANFPSALIDIAQRSSAQGQESLLYEAWTSKIPPRDTPVEVVISAEDDEKAVKQQKGENKATPGGATETQR